MNTSGARLNKATSKSPNRLVPGSQQYTPGNPYSRSLHNADVTRHNKNISPGYSPNRVEDQGGQSRQTVSLMAPAKPDRALQL